MLNLGENSYEKKKERVFIMRKNKVLKLVSLFTAFSLLAAMLTACGQNSGDTEVNNSGSDNTGAGTGTEAVSVYAATGGSPKPFTYVDENNNLTGHNIELIEAVFERLPQYELQIEVTDFSSIFAGLDSDRYQIGVNNFAMNEERKEKYLFSDAMFENRYVAIVAGDSTEFDSIQSLSQFDAKSYVGNAGVNVTTAVENYNEENPDNQIVINYTEADLVIQLQDVESGKYDFLLMDKPMYEYYNAEYNFNLKELDLSDDVSSSVMAEPYSFFIVSKGNEELLENINKALAEVIADGTSKEINEKYFGDDYTPYNE